MSTGSLSEPTGTSSRFFVLKSITISSYGSEESCRIGVLVILGDSEADRMETINHKTKQTGFFLKLNVRCPCVWARISFSVLTRTALRYLLRHLIQNSLEPRWSFLWASTEYESDALYSWLLLEMGGSKCGVKPCFYELSSSDWQNQDLMESLESATKSGYFET